MPIDPVTALTDLHIRASMASPFNSARALSKPNRVLAPPAITYPFIVTLPIVRIPRQTLFADSKSTTTDYLLIFQRFAPGPSNPQFPQLLLQTLPVQPNRRRCA